MYVMQMLTDSRREFIFLTLKFYLWNDDESTSSDFVNWLLKEIFIDSNNTFLWHESEDMNRKILLPKFQLIPILRLQVMHDYVYWHCSIDYCLN